MSDFRFYNTQPLEEDVDPLSDLLTLGRKVTPKSVKKASQKVSKLNAKPKQKSSVASNPWPPNSGPQLPDDSAWSQVPVPINTELAQAEVPIDPNPTREDKDNELKTYRKLTENDIYLDGPDFEQRMQAIRLQPEYIGMKDAEAEATGDMERLLQMPTTSPYLQPLMGLVQAETGKDLSKFVDPGMSVQDKLAAIVSARDKSFNRRGAMQQYLLKGLEGLKSGKMVEEQGNKFVRQLTDYNPLLLGKAGALEQTLPLEIEKLKAMIANINAKTDAIPKEVEIKGKAVDARIAKDTGKGSPKLKALPAKMVTALAEAEGFPEVMTKLKNTPDLHKGSFGPFAGRLGSLNPYDTGAQTIKSRIKAAKQLIGKYMEGGVLRLEDERKYEEILPSLNDTPEVAKMKAQQLEDTLKKDIAAKVKALKASGYDTTAFDNMSLPSVEDFVKMMRNGKTYKIPKDKVDQAEKDGFRLP